MSSPLVCSQCRSSKVAARHYARRTGGAIGVVAGVVAGVAAALGLSKRGGLDAGRIAEAALKAMAGGAVGCKAGAAIGGAIDDNVLANYECESCGHKFGKR